MEFKSARINVLHISVEVITISVSIRQHEPILHGRQLGDYSPNQVASSKILGAMATKMVATWRVEFEGVFFAGNLICNLMVMMMIINFISVSDLLAGHVRPTNRGH